MNFKMKMSTEEYQLPEIGLTAYVRTRYEGGISRLDVSLYEYGVECPELSILRKKVNGNITGEQLSEAYAKLQDEKQCKKIWDDFKKTKVVK